jgi:hypothetical protein
MSFSETSWWIVPFLSITKCVHVPGGSPRSGRLAAKWLRALA